MIVCVWWAWAWLCSEELQHASIVLQMLCLKRLPPWLWYTAYISKEGVWHALLHFPPLKGCKLIQGPQLDILSFDVYDGCCFSPQWHSHRKLLMSRSCKHFSFFFLGAAHQLNTDLGNNYGGWLEQGDKIGIPSHRSGCFSLLWLAAPFEVLRLQPAALPVILIKPSSANKMKMYQMKWEHQTTGAFVTVSCFPAF